MKKFFATFMLLLAINFSVAAQEVTVEGVGITRDEAVANALLLIRRLWLRMQW